MDNPAFEIEPIEENGTVNNSFKKSLSTSDFLPLCANKPAEIQKESRENTNQPASWTQKCAILWRILVQTRIEPIIVLHLLSLLITALVLNDLELDRACRINLKYNETLCDALAERNVTGFFEDEEADVQRLVASIKTWRFAIEYSVPIFLVLLLGSWSDTYGRKFPLIFPMVGSVIKSLGLILCTYFPEWDVKTVVIFVLVPTTLTGSYPLFSMAFHSYIVDTTQHKYRTIRFGIAQACQTIGISLGTVIGGTLFSKTALGFVGTFGVAAGVEVLTIVLTIAMIKNTKANYEGKEELKTPPKKSALSGITDLTHLLEGIKILLRSRPNFGRSKLWILIFIWLCSSTPAYGESSVLYLFLRIRLGWGAGEFGFFGMYQTIAGGVGVLLSMGLLSWWLDLEDCIVGVLGCISQITSCFVYAFATETTIYIAPIMDILNGAMAVTSRSMTTKATDANESGKLLSVLAGLDSVNPVISTVGYTGLYKATLESLPGAFFLLSAALSIPPFLVFAFFSVELLFRLRNKMPRVSVTSNSGS